MKRLLLVEDDPKDLSVAAEAAKCLGIFEVEARTSLSPAQSMLEKGLQGTEPLPDVIVLDLNLDYESGYELLRYWHRTPELSRIPVIVWSILGEEQREMCKLFKVSAYVGKWEGADALREALSRVAAATYQ